jgi:hypothetical protein
VAPRIDGNRACLALPLEDEIEVLSPRLTSVQKRVAEPVGVGRTMDFDIGLSRSHASVMVPRDDRRDEGLLEHAGLDTGVAWVCDLFERIDVDSREERAVAVWTWPS